MLSLLALLPQPGGHADPVDTRVPGNLDVGEPLRGELVDLRDESGRPLVVRARGRGRRRLDAVEVARGRRRRTQPRAHCAPMEAPLPGDNAFIKMPSYGTAFVVSRAPLSGPTSANLC